MRNFLKNTAALVFLALFLPYTAVLLLNGRQGIRQTKDWPELEYRVLERLALEDLSWADEETLSVLAVVFRTECMVHPEGKEDEHAQIRTDADYDRLLRAVEDTRGRAVRIAGEYRSVPYHAVSAGCTRDGSLLGAEYGYVTAAECPEDLESEDYLQICTLTAKELEETFGRAVRAEDFDVGKDAQGYAVSVTLGEAQWTGESFRTLLHLGSSCFRMDDAGDGIRFTVKGSGHGFGVSLYTASRMYREGSSLEEIFQKFCRDAECITIP